MFSFCCTIGDRLWSIVREHFTHTSFTTILRIIQRIWRQSITKGYWKCWAWVLYNFVQIMFGSLHSYYQSRRDSSRDHAQYLAYRLRVGQPTLMDVPIYFWYTFILLYMFMDHIFMTSPLWLAVGPQFLEGGLFTNYINVFLITRLL